MSRNNGKKNYRQQAAEGPQVVTRPARVVRERGSLTFDSYLCCDHTWTPLDSFKGVGPDLLTHGQVAIGMASLRPGQKPEFENVCIQCGAGATYGDVAGRSMIVAYDRDWNYGIPPKPEKNDRPRRQERTDVKSAPTPVTWEDGLPS
jgi:hypothetical protein